MTGAMIQRVAQAIDPAAWAADLLLDEEGGLPQWIRARRALALKKARAAVEAMAAPTEAMHDAARDWSVRKYGNAIGLDASAGCFEAMLAAALAEEPAA